MNEVLMFSGICGVLFSVVGGFVLFYVKKMIAEKNLANEKALEFYKQNCLREVKETLALSEKEPCGCEGRMCQLESRSDDLISSLNERLADAQLKVQSVNAIVSYIQEKTESKLSQALENVEKELSEAKQGFTSKVNELENVVNNIGVNINTGGNIDVERLEKLEENVKGIKVFLKREKAQNR